MYAIWCMQAQGDSIYFATMDSEGKGKAQLFRYELPADRMTLLHTFDEPRIYAFESVEGGIIYAATSKPANLYEINIGGIEAGAENAEKNVKVRRINGENITEEEFIRSLSYSSEYQRCYLGIGTKADLIEVDVGSGHGRRILPSEYQNESFAYAQYLKDNQLYVLLSPSESVLRIDLGTYESALLSSGDSLPIRQFLRQNEGKPGEVIILAGIAVDPNRGERIDMEGLYRWQIDGQSVMGVTNSGILRCIFPKGESGYIDLSDIVQPTLVRPLTYAVNAGVIYVPNRRFVAYDGKQMKKGLMYNEPQASVPSKRGLYTANYTDTTVWFYPYEDLEQIDAIDLSSPEYLVADIEDGQCRPYDMDLTADEKYLVVGTAPQYGKTGGAVSVIDCEKSRLVYTKKLINDQTILSVNCSRNEKDIVYLGTYVYGENTLSRSEEDACLVKMNLLTGEIYFQTVLEQGTPGINDIAVTDEELLYIVGNKKLFLCGGVDGTVMQVNDKKEIVEVESDGDRVFCITRREVYEVDRENLSIHLLADGFTFLNSLYISQEEKTLYFWDDVTLYRYEYQR